MQKQRCIKQWFMSGNSEMFKALWEHSGGILNPTGNVRKDLREVCEGEAEGSNEF